jgi:hypothetical protein
MELHTITTEEGWLLIDKVYMYYTDRFISLNLFPGVVVSFRATVTPIPPQKSLPLSKDNEYYRQPVRLLRPANIQKLASHPHPSVVPATQETALAFLTQQAQEVRARTSFAQHMDSAFADFRTKWQPFSDANHDRDSVEHCHLLPQEAWGGVPFDEIEEMLATASRQQFRIFAGVYIDLYDASPSDATERHLGIRCRWTASPCPHLRPERYAELPLQIAKWPACWQDAYDDAVVAYATDEGEIAPGDAWRAEQRVRQMYRDFIHKRIEVTNVYAQSHQLDLDELSQQLELNLRTMTSEEARELRIRLNQPSQRRSQKHPDQPYPRPYRDRPLPKQLQRRDKWKRPTKRTPVSATIPLNFKLRFYLRWYTHTLPHLEDA